MSTQEASPTPSREGRNKRRQDEPIQFFNRYVLYSNNSERVPFADGDIAAHNGHFEEVLDELRLAIQSDGINLKDKKNYLGELREVGETAYNVLLSENLQNYIKEQETKVADRGLRLNLVSDPAQAFFWEMLYAGDPFAEETDPNQFWGLRYPIGRTFWDIRLSDEIALRDGLLSAIHVSLPKSKEEIESIRPYLEAVYRGSQETPLRLIDDDKFIPPGDYNAKAMRNLLLKKFSSPDFLYGFVHFACHCENPGKPNSSTLAALYFTVHGREFKLKLSDIISFHKYPFLRAPFVFLNACSTANIKHLLQSSHFPVDFLRFGAGGIISTACAIPDEFAACFAQEFYRRLLDRNRLRPIFIADVLWETRLHFLEKYNNPLGLAYGLYAMSHQQFRHPEGERGNG